MGRAFQRQFDFAECVEVMGATLENRLLEIALNHELPDFSRAASRSVALWPPNRP
jgi:HSP20 family molecular chaperone IbpA